MTGILPIKKYGTHSALNMFNEFTMIKAGTIAEFVGFTTDEVQDLCQIHQIDFQQCKSWYDGYQIDILTSVYTRRQNDFPRLVSLVGQ